MISQSTLIEIGNLISAFGEIIPFILCLYYFKKTRIIDYLLLSIFFITDMVASILLFDIDLVSEYKLIFVLVEVLLITSLYVLFIHALRVNWETLPKYGLYLATGVYLVTLLLIILVSKQNLDEGIKFWFIPTEFSEETNQFAFTINGNTVLYGLDLNYNLLRIIIFNWLILSYLTAQVDFSDSKTRKATILWILISELWLVTSWDFVLFYFSITPARLPILIAAVPTFIGMWLFSLIAGLYPESILVTKSQIANALTIYDKFLKADRSTGRITKNEIDDYLDKIKVVSLKL
ncbi:MAG: hypothetical protein ACW99A_22065 [Candidatus Kariarchaeaceae archaeon]